MGDEKLIIISVAVGGINDIFVDNEHTHNQDSFFGGSPHKTGADCSIWTTMLSVQNEKTKFELHQKYERDSWKID